MDTGNIMILVVKVSILLMLFIYLLIGVLIARQVFLMNRAIKTKLTGCLNLLVLLHVGAIFVVFLITLFV